MSLAKSEPSEWRHLLHSRGKVISMQMVEWWQKSSFWESDLFLGICLFFQLSVMCRMWEFSAPWPAEDVKWKLGFKFPFSSFPPLSLRLSSSLSLFFSFHYRLTLWSFWAAWQHIIKSSKLREGAQVILPSCSMKPASSCALLADSSWFSVDKEGSTYIIRFVLFLPMIKRRRFPLPSFEIFAEVHSQQTSLLSASTIVIGLQIFFFSPLPP